MQVTVDVLVAQLCYGGNGGVATIIPEVGDWLTSMALKAKDDPRIGRLVKRRYGDVPLTMERNRIVRDAIDGGFDMIVMLDSDNAPDLYLGKRPWAKPFWETSFDFAFERLKRGLPTVVAAPYCGPNPHPANGGESTVYMFYSQGYSNNPQNPGFRVEAYAREHAAQMRGIQEVMAAPTGCILYTTSALELLQFDRRSIVEILADYKNGVLTAEQCQRRIQMQSYFFYEYTNQWQTAKASTEDVTNTREIGMAGQLKFGEPVVFANWDTWCGHNKPEMIGMPEPIRMEQVSAVYQEAVLKGVSAFEHIEDVDFTGGRKVSPEQYEQAAEAAVSSRKIIVADEQTNPDDEPEYHEETDGHESKVNPEIKARMICGRKMTSVGHVTPDADLQALTAMAKNVGKLNQGRPLRMLEVGSWVGESAVALLGGAPSDSRIYCVDHWEGCPSDWTCHIAREVDVWGWFVKNTEDLLGTSIFPVKGDSVQAAQDMGDSQELDLVFIDADHEKASVAADIQAWLRHLAPNGVLCGHDYRAEFPGVVEALEEFLGPLGLTPSRIHGTTVWFVTKTAIDQARAKLAMTATAPQVILADPQKPILDPTVAANRA